MALGKKHPCFLTLYYGLLYITNAFFRLTQKSNHVLLASHIYQILFALHQ